MTDRIELGDRVRDRISLYEGICTAKALFLTGCDQIGIKPQGVKESGGTHDCLWFDEPFVEVLERAAIAPVVERKANSGGPGFTFQRG